MISKRLLRNDPLGSAIFYIDFCTKMASPRRLLRFSIMWILGELHSLAGSDDSFYVVELRICPLTKRQENSTMVFVQMCA